MQPIHRIPLVAVLFFAIRSQPSALAESTLCKLCPVPGVNFQQTTSLGTTNTGGTCKTHPAVPEAVFANKKFTTKCVRDCLTDGAKKKTMYKSYGIKQNASCELDQDATFACVVLPSQPQSRVHYSGNLASACPNAFSSIAIVVQTR